MPDNMTDNHSSARTCIQCGETFHPKLIDSGGRCSACSQAAERFIDEFSMSLGRWAENLRATQQEPAGAETARKKRKFTLPRLVIVLFLVFVGYFAYEFFANYHMVRTEWLLNHGHIDKARLQLEKAIEADSHNPNLRYVLGNLFYQQGQMDSAIEAFRQTIELDSLHAGAMNNLAWAYAQEKEHLDEALKLSKRSLEIDPDNPYYLDTIAEIYFLKKEYYRALTYMRKAVELDPPNIEYYIQRLEIIKNLVYRQDSFIEI
jgi:tetratricopeptide (TPR) repeat protein